MEVNSYLLESGPYRQLIAELLEGDGKHVQFESY